MARPSSKKVIGAIAGAILSVFVALEILPEGEASDGLECIEAMSADLDSTDFHPWRESGCQAVAARLVSTIAAEFGAEWVADVVASVIPAGEGADGAALPTAPTAEGGGPSEPDSPPADEGPPTEQGE